MKIVKCCVKFSQISCNMTLFLESGFSNTSQLDTIFFIQTKGKVQKPFVDTLIGSLSTKNPASD
jgi:hypothetical protein